MSKAKLCVKKGEIPHLNTKLQNKKGTDVPVVEY